LGLLLRELEPRLADLEDRPGRDRLCSAYRARCATIGRSVRVSTTRETITGTALDLTAAGHLVIDAGGPLVTVAAGDVVHVRGPADGRH